MQILIAAGGTAGHINPALAIASYIKEQMPNAQIHFAGCKNGMESRLVKAAGYPFYEIEVRGIQRKLNFTNVKRNLAAMYYLATSIPRANKILKQIKPELVIGTGGYVSGPIVRAAAKKGIKTAIHEQNAFPGVTNKLLAKQVDIVFAPSQKAAQKLGAIEKTVVVGNPVRQDFLRQNKEVERENLKISANEVLIVSFGGSLGAQKLNEAIAELAQWEMKNPDAKIKHIHASGSIEKQSFEQLLKEKNIDKNSNFEVREYIKNMPKLLSAADLVICRAGALTLAELSATGRASILIPSPNVAENHQYHNAMQFQNENAAVVITEKELDAQKIVNTVKELLQDKSSLKTMGENAKKLAHPDALAVIYEKLSELIKS